MKKNKINLAAVEQAIEMDAKIILEFEVDNEKAAQELIQEYALLTGRQWEMIETKYGNYFALINSASDYFEVNVHIIL